MKIIGTEKIFFIPVGTKKYPLIISETDEIDPTDGPVVHVYCEACRLNQEYLKADLPVLLDDIGELIIAELSVNQTSQIHIRVKPTEKTKIEENAMKNGYKSVSEFLKHLALAQ